MVEKTCISCSYFMFEASTPDYSDMTPGSDACIVCMKGHYSITLNEMEGQEEYRKTLLQAMKCKHFSQRL